MFLAYDFDFPLPGGRLAFYLERVSKLQLVGSTLKSAGRAIAMKRCLLRP
jgi:hypothetical protein